MTRPNGAGSPPRRRGVVLDNNRWEWEKNSVIPRRPGKLAVEAAGRDRPAVWSRPIDMLIGRGGPPGLTGGGVVENVMYDLAPAGFPCGGRPGLSAARKDCAASFAPRGTMTQARKQERPSLLMCAKHTKANPLEKMIGLIRVSTDKQAASGLGLEAQQDALERMRVERSYEVVKTYQEVESGKHKDIRYRPQLRDAVTHCQMTGAVLVIAKIDRLVRSTQVMAFLKDSGIKFLACDNPYANNLTINILVAVAENEAEQISIRTKDALAAYKKHKRVSKRIKLLYPDGVPADVVKATAGKLGASLPQCRTLTEKARKNGAIASAEVRRLKAVRIYGHIAPLMVALRLEGKTYKEIAARLRADGHQTRYGKVWSRGQVRRVLKRLQ